MASNGPHSNPANSINGSSSNGPTHGPVKSMPSALRHHHRMVNNSPTDGVISAPSSSSAPVIDSNSPLGDIPSGGQSNDTSNSDNRSVSSLIVNGSSQNCPLRSSPSSSTQYSSSNNNSRQISKLKRLLSTLHQFVADTSSDMGDRVHSLIIGLVVSFCSSLFETNAKSIRS